MDEIHQILCKTAVIIFKNSPVCPVSRAARSEFEKFAEKSDDSVDLYMVDVINSRNISNSIEKQTKIKHESPQVMLLKNNTVVWHASHGEITAKKIEEVLNTYR